MSVVNRFMQWYFRIAEMPDIPSIAQLEHEITRRMEKSGTDEEATVQEMLTELGTAQASVDNRCDAVMKVGAFIGTGLAVLGKFDTKSPIPGLSIAVVIIAGLSLGAALFAKNSPLRRPVILLPPTPRDLHSSCQELQQNQTFLIVATLLLFPGLVAALVAVVLSASR